MSSRADRKQAARVIREQLAREKARARRMWVSIAVIAVLVIAGLVGFGVYESQRSSTYAKPAHATANADGLVVGNGSKTVEVYLDFMCPICGQFEKSSGSTLNQMASSNQIKLVYHPLAFLDRASSGTQYSTRSAAAAGCASDAGKLPEYVQTMYANQPAEGSTGLTDDQIIQLAHKAGISGSGFDSCVRDGKYKSWVQYVTDSAVKRGVTGTPTVYVNGKVTQADLPSITAALGS